TLAHDTEQNRCLVVPSKSFSLLCRAVGVRNISCYTDSMHTIHLEGNMCADYLAKLGTRSTNGLLMVLDPLAELCLLTANSMSVA
ncbi:hypothetical protein A2U01_0023000, partial [Trifolium medium]|nr:hypothetical protein [Trifolium medium]